MMNPFTPRFEHLPESLPIFPLPGAVVMPGVQLPLNIFEPRYLSMVFDALGGARMIGMVQPDPNAPHSEPEAVFSTGTAGRITSFSETSDGRLKTNIRPLEVSHGRDESSIPGAAWRLRP